MEGKGREGGACASALRPRASARRPWMGEDRFAQQEGMAIGVGDGERERCGRSSGGTEAQQRLTLAGTQTREQQRSANAAHEKRSAELPDGGCARRGWTAMEDEGLDRHEHGRWSGGRRATGNGRRDEVNDRQ